MNFYHKELAAGRWFELTLAEQMANIGSEVHRTIDWFRRGNKKYYEISFEKALELFDLTLADGRWKGRRKEIARSREYFCGLFYGDSDPSFRQEDMDWLDKYFLEFAISVRLLKEQNNYKLSRA